MTFGVLVQISVYGTDGSRRASVFAHRSLAIAALYGAHPWRIQMATMKATEFVKPGPAARHCPQE
ncbi:hypothetical protein [Paraburkholderia sp. GAS334]|uniref:hypothetical protein n=1 Tax=Paraburkholderia sp. GAS334 TaxID=3035131 RepID=UPI003D24D746